MYARTHTLVGMVRLGSVLWFCELSGVCCVVLMCSERSPSRDKSKATAQSYVWCKARWKLRRVIFLSANTF